jgi:hypothetical protein
MGGHTASTGLGSSTAGLGALAPSSEGRDLAVHRAWAVSAALGFGQGGAGNATVSGGGGNMAGTRLGASSASFGASSPLREHRHHAVDWAGLSVAITGLL